MYFQQEKLAYMACLQLFALLKGKTEVKGKRQKTQNPSKFKWGWLLE